MRLDCKKIANLLGFAIFFVSFVFKTPKTNETLAKI